MCLDFNAEQPHLLAVGCYDGTVMVYDLRSQVSQVVSIKMSYHSTVMSCYLRSQVRPLDRVLRWCFD